MPELTGDEKRRAYIYLPASYRNSKEKRYPVLYMFDGHNVFFDDDATYGKSWGMKEYMDRTRTQMIIVGIECNRHPDNSRLSEYSPYDFEFPECGKIKGKGRITMNWLTKVLKPYIDKTYRTLPDRDNTFIAGSSMGGLMSIYALLAYNRVFSKAAALSPSLWANTPRIRKLIKTAHLHKDTTLYMDFGSRELPEGRVPEEYTELGSLLLSRGIYVTSRFVPDGIHNEVSWEKQIPIFMWVLQYEE